MPRPRPHPSAAQLAARQRNISVAEFFARNRHLLGFDSPFRAVLTAVKEAVDNALDACEDAGILPEISVQVSETGERRFKVVVEDNGPGIVEEQVGRIYGKLLYGSRFHRLSQSRGQQGLGIAAAGLYGQLTAGKPMLIRTRTRRQRLAREMLVSVDTTHNRPEVRKKHEVDWDVRHGTRVETELEGQHRSGAHSVLRYLELTAMANPHVTLRLTSPDGTKTVLARSTRRLPPTPVEIKPHPHGVELGLLIAMLKQAGHRSLSAFLREQFSRVGTKTAKQIIEAANHGLSGHSRPRRVSRRQAGALHRAIRRTKISAPATDCVVPIGQEQIVAALRKETGADFVYAVSRPPSVYRGNPFRVEVGLAYGRRPSESPAANGEAQSVTLLRFANRVPLLFQQGACVTTRAVVETKWKNYGVAQARGALPTAPMTLLLHIASVWVPFTSESKEAIAGYDELKKEFTLALMECGRKLRVHIAKQKQLVEERKRRAHIDTFLPHIASALSEILELAPERHEAIVTSLSNALTRERESH